MLASMVPLMKAVRASAERIERRAVLLLAEHAHRSERSPVEASERRHEAASTGGTVGQLERAFVGLGAARDEERAMNGGRRDALQALGQLELGPCIDHVGGLHESRVAHTLVNAGRWFDINFSKR